MSSLLQIPNNTNQKVAMPTIMALRNSKTTKDSEIVEKALASVFQKLFIRISNEKDYPWNLASIRQTYDLEVYAKIRKAVQEQYLIGSRYVEQSLKIESFLSAVDEFTISRSTDDGVSHFWRKVDILANNQIEVMLAEDFGLEPPHLLNFKYILLLLSTTISTSVLGISTLSKTRQMLEAAGIDINRVQFRWVALVDEKTCLVLPNGQPGCKLLNGTIWQFWQYNEIPTPGGIGLSPTHYNCRCRVVIIYDGKQKLL